MKARVRFFFFFFQKSAKMDKNIRKIGKHFLMFEKGTIPGVNIARMKGLQYALPAPTKRERRDINFKTVLNNSKTTVQQFSL